MTVIRAIKNDAGDWVLDVLGNPFGGPNDRDSDGEYFDAGTQFHEDKYAAPPIVYYHGFDPVTKLPSGDPQYIGRTVARETRPDGVWYRVILDKANELAKKVWEAAQKGLAVASSGSMPHLARVDRTGRIAHWPVTELSLWDNDGSRPQANRYAVALPAMQKLYKAAGIDLPLDIEPEPEADAEGAGAPVQSAKAAKVTVIENDIQQQEEPEMGDEVKQADNVEERVQAAMKAFFERQEAEAKAAADLQAKIDEAVAATEKRKDEEWSARFRLPDGGMKAPHQAQFGDTAKYDSLDAGDQAFLVGLLDGHRKSGNPTAGPTDGALKALALKLGEDKTEVGAAGRRAMKAAGLIGTDGAIKANELNYSTQASYGDEWVGVAYSTRLWESIRSMGRVVPRIPTIEVPSGHESMVLPLESTDPTFYKVAQSTANDSTMGIPVASVTASKLTTAQKSLTLAKMGARVVWSGEMEEDSLIPWVSNLRRQLEAAGAEQLEHAVIDGDTETGASTNINDIAGTPTATDLFLMFNGFRKSPLITTTANSRSASGSLADTDFKATTMLMGTAGLVGSDKQRVAFILDANTYNKALELASVKTQDVFSGATLEDGELTRIWGYEVIRSYFMHYAQASRLANTAGKVDQNTAGNNTTGAILAVRFDQWLLGYRRRMTIETQRIPQADATQIVALMRLGLAQRDTEASAITYNVGV